MDGPRRVRLRRTSGWRKPAGAVVVSRPSKLGNPFAVGTLDPFAQDKPVPMTAEVAVAHYRSLMEERLAVEPHRWQAELERLRGRDLCCWCPLDQACHADVLLELANR